MPKRIIDLSQNTVYGYEPSKSVETVDAIIRGIEAGDDIPLVKVLDTPEGLVLDPFEIVMIQGQFIGDGGHNRALAYYFLGDSLPAIVRKSERPIRKTLIPLGEIELRNDPSDYSTRRSVQHYR